MSLLRSLGVKRNLIDNKKMTMQKENIVPREEYG